MKMIQSILTFVILGMVTALAQVEDAATPATTSTASNKVSNLEIEQLVHSTRLKEWGEAAKKSNFANYGTPRKRVYASGSSSGGYEYTLESSDPIERAWKDLAPQDANSEKPRSLKIGWKPEWNKAIALLQRPCNDDQRKWLTRFAAACDALDKRDAKTFADLVPALVEDYRSLL